MLKINESELKEAIEATYNNLEFEALADFYDGQDEPFYQGLRLAFAYQQVKLNKLAIENHEE